MRAMIEEMELIAECVVYLAVSPLVFLVCKTLELTGTIDEDETDD